MHFAMAAIIMFLCAVHSATCVGRRMSRNAKRSCMDQDIYFFWKKWRWDIHSPPPERQ